MLTDNGGHFTGRYLKPLPVEVLFEKICRDNGIKQRLTKPRSPITTGKIERFHKTLRTEFLDHVAPFESLSAAQEAIQALDKAVPASLFRPNGPTRLEPADPTPAEQSLEQQQASLAIGVIEPPQHPSGDGAAVEFDVRVSPAGDVAVRSGRQVVSLHQSMAGRTVTVWADLRSIHVSCDGHVIRTVALRRRTVTARSEPGSGGRKSAAGTREVHFRRRTGLQVRAAVQLSALCVSTVRPRRRDAGRRGRT